MHIREFSLTPFLWGASALVAWGLLIVFALLAISVGRSCHRLLRGKYARYRQRARSKPTE